MPTRDLTLRINGEARALHADANMPLLYALRNACDLKGTRFGCGANQCGACHVLIDGRSLPACDTPLWAVEGKSVETIEGLARSSPSDGPRGGIFRALQQAFVDEQAAQCGYCLSGILVSACALLEQQPRPDEAQVRAALDKHLCRCGSHNRIVRAVLRVAVAEPTP